MRTSKEQIWAASHAATNVLKKQGDTELDHQRFDLGANARVHASLDWLLLGPEKNQVPILDRSLPETFVACNDLL